MTELIAKDISISSGTQTLVKSASFSLRSGELIALLGPNGAGKTTLLKAALGAIQAETGQITLDGVRIANISALNRARKLTYLPQKRGLAWPNKVRDVVALGRYAYGANMGGRLREMDAQAVKHALVACDLTHLADRASHTLSGGELARMHCARAFATQAPLLIADEPVAALDPRHQFRVMDLMKTFVTNGGGALIVLHDLSLAAQYADRIIWMKAGEVISTGTVDETLTEDRLAHVYGIKAKINGRHVHIDGALD